MSPSFIIIGSQKGGTSSLFHYLKYHPQIKRPIKKEMHFFNLNYDKGINWYLAHFPMKSAAHITGEASPDYLFHEHTAERIKQMNPHMKLIVLLRNPIERAYSAYQMNRRMGIDPRPTFQDAVDFELNHLKSTSDQYNYEKHNFYYLQRSKYAEQLSRWIKHFSQDRFMVIESQSFFDKTKEALLKIYEFLGITPVLPQQIKPINVGKYPAISNELYASLKNYFESDLLQLKEQWNIEFAMG